MRSGTLRHTITFMSATETKSSTGAVTDNYTFFAVVRADIRDLDTGNRYMSQRFNSMVTKQVYIRYVAGMQAGMRFVFGGSTYQIEPPRDASGRERMLEIHASEVFDV